MLKKLLKHDLKAMVKYWWILAVLVMGFSFLGGIGAQILDQHQPSILGRSIIYTDGATHEQIPEVIITTANAMIMLAIFSLLLFAIATFFIVYRRFYKNFFTDEAYLTFTLPAKRSTLLNSKILSSGIIMFMSYVIITFGILIIVLMGSKDLTLAKILRELFKLIGEELPNSIFFILELLIIGILGTLFSILVLFFSISVGAVLAKKHKTLSAIAVYWVINMVISYIFEIYSMYIFDDYSNAVLQFAEPKQSIMMHMFILSTILILAIACSVVYLLQYRILDRKLNLA